jgi:hypothetical protein
MKGSRLLDALGFDMPSCEIILEYADETIFRVFAQVSAVYSMQIITSAIPLGEGVRHKQE